MCVYSRMIDGAQAPHTHATSRELNEARGKILITIITVTEDTLRAAIRVVVEVIIIIAKTKKEINKNA